MKKISIALVLAMLISLLPVMSVSADGVTLSYKIGEEIFAIPYEGTDTIVIDFGSSVGDTSGITLTDTTFGGISYTGSSSGNTYTLALTNARLTAGRTYTLEIGTETITIPCVKRIINDNSDPNVELMILEDSFDYATVGDAFGEVGADENQDTWAEYAYLSDGTRDTSQIYSSLSDDKALKVTFNGNSITKVQKLFPNVTYGYAKIEMDVKAESGATVYAGFRSQNAERLAFRFQSGKISFVLLDSESYVGQPQIGTYSYDTWYHIEMEFDVSKNLVNYRITDENGNVVAVAYDAPTLQKIMDGGVRGVQLRVQGTSGTSGYLDNVRAYIPKELSSNVLFDGADEIRMGSQCDNPYNKPTESGTLDLTKWHHMSLTYDKDTKKVTTEVESEDGTYTATRERTLTDMADGTLDGIWLQKFGETDYYIDNLKITEGDAAAEDTTLLNLTFDSLDDIESFKSLGTAAIEEFTDGDHLGNVLHFTKSNSATYKFNHDFSKKYAKVEFDIKLNSRDQFLLKTLYKNSSNTDKEDVAIAVTNKFNGTVHSQITRTIESVTDGIVKYTMRVVPPSGGITIKTGTSDNAIPITFKNSSVYCFGTVILGEYVYGQKEIGSYTADTQYWLTVEVDHDNRVLAAELSQTDGTLIGKIANVAIADKYTDFGSFYASAGKTYGVTITRESEPTIFHDTAETPVISKEKVSFYAGGVADSVGFATDEIRLDFDMDMDIRTIENVRVENTTDGEDVRFYVVKNTDDTYSLKIVDVKGHKSTLLQGCKYKLTIPSSVKSVSGGNLTKPLEMEFNTQSGSTEASLSVSFEGSSDVALSNMVKDAVIDVKTAYTNNGADKKALLMFCYYQGTELKTITKSVITLKAGVTDGEVKTAHRVRNLTGIDKLSVILWELEENIPLSQNFINIK